MAVPPVVNADRRAASTVGVLFLVALILYLVGSLIYAPSTGLEVFLERAHPERGTVTFGLLIEFVAVMAIPLIGFFAFPVLRRWSEALALTYVGFRALEAVLLIASTPKPWPRSPDLGPTQERYFTWWPHQDPTPRQGPRRQMGPTCRLAPHMIRSTG